MSSFYCTKCGLEAFGKCHLCRNIYASHPNRDVELIEQVMSHRLLLDDPKKLKVKLFSDETWADALITMRDLLKDRTDEECRIFACTHEWDFKPFAKSEIECGHGSEEKPLIDYMSDAWYRLTDATTHSPEGNHCEVCEHDDIWCRHFPEPGPSGMKYPRDENDKEAAAIIHAALEAIDEGVDLDYKDFKKGGE